MRDILWGRKILHRQSRGEIKYKFKALHDIENELNMIFVLEDGVIFVDVRTNRIGYVVLCLMMS